MTNLAESNATVETGMSEDANVRTVLWTSLIVELRSKLSAMEAAGQLLKTKIDEPLLHEFNITVGDSFMSVWLNTGTGKGSWNAITKVLDMAESWFLSPEGVFEIDAEAMNFSAAADRFIAKVSGRWIRTSTA